MQSGGKHFDFESEHHKLWDAGASKDWEKASGSGLVASVSVALGDLSI